MQLTLIPDDPTAETTDVSITSNKKGGSSFAMTSWKVTIGKYTSGGRHFRRAIDGGVPTDVAGWDAVVWDENGGIVTAGEIDDVQQAGQSYELTLIETPTPMPDFLS